MSRPTTRGKNKRHKKEENADDHYNLLRKIHASGEITEDDVNKLFMIWKPVCKGCRVNSKDNPNCFCGLIPPPNGVRKSGLWQKMSEIIQSIGPVPSPDPRASDDWPAGLTNLGATCYANSILQFMYMNRSFRNAVFSVEPDVLKQKPVLGQLARLFAQLYAAKMSSVDSAPFIQTLELDNGVQQDSHEFMTLLLSLLESCLSHSKVSSARSVVQDLFRGIVSHVTICSSCQKDSEASSKMEDFYELELNIKGLKTLDESLDDYLSVEELDGDNQYFCESCEQRVRASRRIKLRNLPNVLNFQLKRCIFLPKTTTKKKITSSFSFPGILDMRERLSENSSSSWIYDLSAVLLHKGTAVNSGHYIAHIKDQNTGVWWEFDDEQVTKLGSHPFAESSSKDFQTANSGSEKGEATAAENDCRTNTAVSNRAKVFSSSDAYMLMYTRRVETPCDGASVQSNQEMSSQDGCLPAYLLEDVEAVNASYVLMCKEYQVKKEEMESHIAERRQEVRSVLAEAPVQVNESSYFWISTDWLRQWSDTIHPTAVDNTTIQCMHGKVPASKVSSMKRVGVQAWVNIISKYDGGPALSNADQCTDCLRDGAKSIVSADSYRDRRMKMRDVAALVLSGQCSNGEFYVSRTWLQQWFRRKNVDAPSEADAAPTAALSCPHGLLLPEKASGARRLLVPSQLWNFLYEDAMAVKNEVSSECKMFSEESDLCASCSDELSEVASWEDSQRLLKVKQRQNHEKLSSGKKIPLSLQSQYYLVPTAWLLKWKNYISTSGKNNVEKPETLDVIIDSLKCEKHLRLSERPPELECKRGVLYQKGSPTDGLTIIPEDDWHSFCEEWGGHKDNFISATIVCLADEKTEEHPSSDDHVTQTDTSSNNLVLKTVPELCAECVGDKESHQLIEKLNYCDELICVTLVHGKEAPKSFMDAPETERRTTKRSRKSRDANTVHLKVSGSTSIYQLKMMIWESLGVVKENQIIRKGQRVIDDESATLADCSVFPGDKLWVQDSEIYEPRDIADELGEQRMGAGFSEEGFRGTILTADKSSQSV